MNGSAVFMVKKYPQRIISADIAMYVFRYRNISP